MIFLDFSIGSLGAGNSEDYVSDVVVNRAKLSGTTNGVRIKTWQVSEKYEPVENIDSLLICLSCFY